MVNDIITLISLFLLFRFAEQLIIKIVNIKQLTDKSDRRYYERK